MEFKGSIVRKVRQEQGHKQYFFAHLTGISQAKLSKIENGLSIPTLPELITILVFLERPLGHFVS